jgi:hypothetical protein
MRRTDNGLNGVHDAKAASIGHDAGGCQSSGAGKLGLNGAIRPWATSHDQGERMTGGGLARPFLSRACR